MLIKIKKIMGRLTKKNPLGDWFVPKKMKRSKLGEVIRVYHTKKRHTVTISIDLLDKYDIKIDELGFLRAAFNFTDPPLVVFNPIPGRGIPWIKFIVKNGAKSPSYWGLDLCTSFVNAFGLSNRCSYYDFTLREMEKAYGMMHYELILVDEVDCE